MARPKKVKEQATGKDFALTATIEVSTKKSLNEIWGRKFSKFRASSAEEYLTRLRKMTKLDLQNECIKLGRTPMDNREKMITTLLKDCKQYMAAVATSGLQPKPLKVSDAGRQILSKLGGSLV